MTAPRSVTASVLCAPLFDGPGQELQIVHRSPSAWQLANEKDIVVACVIFPGAVRLPHAVAVQNGPSASPTISVGDGALTWDGVTLTVARWWRPARPRINPLRGRVNARAARELALSWRSLLGLGDGLTPYGDDVVCGALIALHASGHPLAFAWSREVKAAALEHKTTATSAGLLRLAADGYCIDELRDFLVSVARREGLAAARDRLLSVGRSSGQGLLEGASRVLGAESVGRRRERGAAA